MNRAKLEKIAAAARCRVVGWEDAGNDGHRAVLGALIEAFDFSESAILVEPSLARKTRRPPDVVLIDPEIGVHTFEVKTMELERIDGIDGGGYLSFRYGNGVRTKSPIAQVRTAMFDIKDATERAYKKPIGLRFEYWVVFPRIRRAAWKARFGSEGYCADEFVFADELTVDHLVRRLGASDRGGSNVPIEMWPLDQLQCVWTAFGDTSVLYATPLERRPRSVEQGTLGKQFDEAAEGYKNLSDEQQRLSAMHWEAGPRLVRGVAGSGKTVVLANNLARRLERMEVARSEQLFGNAGPPARLLAVCFNRTLAPMLERKIQVAFKQRTGRDVPAGELEVCAFNQLMFKLADAGVWKYQTIGTANEIARAIKYSDELEQFGATKQERLQRLAYDAIYVDEGQDFLEEEYRILKGLCRTNENGEPNLYVFYDDAQNLYGRIRPNWQSLGLNVRGGRAFVMTECFRNTRQIIEPTFNVLYGTCAGSKRQGPTKEFGDIATLEQKRLIREDGGFWRVKFAARAGRPTAISMAPNRKAENELILARLRWLLADQQVRPQDMMVLSHQKDRAAALAKLIEGSKLPGVKGVHLATQQKDHALGQPGRLTVSTVASAKGYDAYCVLLASTETFGMDVTGRASFYVGCTRAIEYLEVFACREAGLVVELREAVKRMKLEPAWE